MRKIKGKMREKKSAKGLFLSKLIVILILLWIVGFVLTISTKAENSTPQIIFEIDFPSKIKANGEKVKSFVFFKDPDKDITEIRFEITDSHSAEPVSFDPNVKGKVSGVIPFSIATTSPPLGLEICVGENGQCKELLVSDSAPEQATLHVSLVDETGNHSSPGSFSFTVITITSPCTIKVREGGSIQTEIEEAQEGAVVCLAEGNWDENIKITKSLKLRGVSQEQTIIKGKNEDKPVIVIDNNSKVMIETLTVAEAKEGKDGIWLGDEAEVVIQSASISNNGQHGIHVRGSAVADLHYCNISDNLRDGIVVEDSAKVRIFDSTISGNEKNHGLWISGSGQLEIIDSLFSNNGKVGIGIELTAKADISGSIIAQNKKNGL